jgi:predicted Zn-dependent peptidase
MKWVVVLALVMLIGACTTQKYKEKSKTDKNGYSYVTYTKDPLDMRLYTLKNGLKVYLTCNTDEPRISTLIGVRAGSVNDPPETTGLAHYFEHMMFKGTDEIGTLDWEKEKVVLQQISDAFEKHRAESDPARKLAIYKQIDSLSGVAAQYVAANEYDKMVSSLGAKSTNAGTSYESTVYINDIPSNELEKWLMLESERFKDIVLRLFHTELETVYEEFNMYQDMDAARADEALMKSVFPNHPYGRDVIGLPEHLKNPSMINIMNFAKKWYVPNNMAIVLSGDLDFDETIKMVDKYFGPLEPNNELPDLKQPTEEPIAQPIEKDIYGPDAESMTLAFRFNGANSEDEKYVTIIDYILSNSKAGLIDLDLNQQQKVLRASSGSYFLRDYGIHEFSGTPREGQKLEEVKDLLLGEIEKVKKGEFDDWLPEAIVNDMRLQKIRAQERNMSRAFELMNVFIDKVPYADHLRFIDDLEKITREQIISYAKEHYGNNYAVVYKRTGENKDAVKVEKPPITAVPINREDQSEFQKKFTAMDSKKIEPVFVDYATQIVNKELGSGIPVSYIENKANELFSLNYVIDMGKSHNLKLPLAVNYLPFLGTDKYSAADLQKELYKYGLSLNVSTADERSYVTISGLQKSFEKGVELLEHVLSSVKPDQKAYDDYVDGILKKRSDDKLNKNTILYSGLVNFGKYGKLSPFTNILSADELKAINPAELTDLIKDIYSYKHYLFVYSQEGIDKLIPIIGKYHKTPETLKDYPEPVVYTEQSTDQSTVYFVNYDMVQANIVLLSKGPVFEKFLIPPSRLFGEYFGSGLSSIVFQEIREARGLAYSAYASFSQPPKLDKSFYLIAFVGTQADKLKIATDAMLAMMNDMPRAQQQFDLAKEAILSKIESERIIKANIYWNYVSLKDLGLDYDVRKDVYEYVKTATMDQFAEFFNKNISGQKYTYLVMGNRNMVDFNVLSQLGTVKELTLEELFNY